MKKVRMAIIGLGNRGYGNMQAVMSFDDVQITAVCDVYTDRAERAAAKAEEKYGVRPFSTTDYREVLTRGDVDCVMIATAWESHVPIAIDTMRAGKPVALEVGGAYSAEDCRNLVSTYEETKTPFLFLENCCYDRTELLVTAMARKGLIGEIVHCSGAYGHDLREEILHGKENKHYRLRNYIHRNCENYPTHELGPIA
ncbi:MAG TPA: glycosyl hydrolase, partial [Ruminococcaceae bacterium]|nr:glycosyl hydrolase [Oscillospiraceae bacterium]